MQMRTSDNPKLEQDVLLTCISRLILEHGQGTRLYARHTIWDETLDPAQISRAIVREALLSSSESELGVLGDIDPVRA